MHSDITSRQAITLNGAEKSIILKSLGQNRILIFIVLSYLIAGHFVSAITGNPLETLHMPRFLWAVTATIPVFLLSMLLWRFGNMVLNVRPEKPVGWLCRDIRDNVFLDSERMLNGAIAFFGIVFFAAVFSYLKDSIPVLNPFAWDETFAEWDRVLHGGYDPYVLLAPIFANVPMTVVADTSYGVWFFLIYFFSFTACMDKENPIRRNTYLFSFFLTWIIGGTVLATILSSVGPVYYEEFGYGDHFAPLLDYLNEVNKVVPVAALELQSMLLVGYSGEGNVSGISAMPSMHVALSWIITFQAFQYRKVLGWMMVAFAILIQLSSVHLGWHYAIDGYLGFVVAIAAWYIAKLPARLQAKFDTRSAG